MLAYFAVSPNCEKHLIDALEHIDKDNLLTPLAVIKILSQSDTVHLQVIKDYLSRRLSKDSIVITDDMKQIRQFKEGTALSLLEV